MKILVLSNLYPPDFIGGYEIVCAQAVDALRARGHEVLVLTAAPRRPVPSTAHVDRTLQLSDVYTAHFLEKLHWPSVRGFSFASHWVNAANVHRLLEVLARFQPDVAYLHNLVGLGGLGLLACLQHQGVPWVWQLGDAIPRVLCTTGDLSPAEASLVDPTCQMLVQEFNRRIRGHYLVVSRRLLAEIEESGLKLQGRVELLSNWFVGTPVPRTQYLQGNHLRIVNAGQISKFKGIDLLIEAAGELRARGYHNFSVDIYGRVQDPTFQCLIGKMGVEDCVTLKGLRSPEEVFQMYNQYDVFAFPTWPREPFGCAPLDAAAQGCVPLLANVCGISEWLVNHVHCLKADRSVEAFTEVLQQILDGAIDLHEIGRRGGQLVRRDFHLDVLAPRIERALEEAARSPRHGAGSAGEAYRLALLAEKLTQVLASEAA